MASNNEELRAGLAQEVTGASVGVEVKPKCNAAPCCSEEHKVDQAASAGGQMGGHVIITPGNKKFKCSKECKVLLQGETRVFSVSEQYRHCTYHITDVVRRALSECDATFWFLLPDLSDKKWLERCGQMIDCRRKLKLETRLECISNCGFRFLLFDESDLDNLPSRFKNIPHVIVPRGHPTLEDCQRICREMDKLKLKMS